VINPEGLSHNDQASHTLEQMIKKIRVRLEENPYAQIEVSAIKWECTKPGISPPREPLGCNNIHQADLLGPRYIKNDGRFYSLHVIGLN
jgi:hypothetical protein